SNDNLSFTILSGNIGDAFALDFESGELTVQTPTVLDFETTPTFNLEVEVNDGNGGTASATMTIELIDVNETPSIATATFTIDENCASGTSVGTLAATDPDGDALTFVILSGNTDDAFSLNATPGEIIVQNQS